MRGITLHDFGNDIAAVIRHYGVPAVIVGHAFGNWVARTTATDHPELVRGVVIAAAAAKTYPGELSVAVTKSGDMSLPKEERLKYLRGTFFAPGNDPAIWLDGWHAEASEAQRLAALATKQAEWWSAGNVPLLDLQADNDPFHPIERKNELRDELGDRVSIAVIRNASHALLPEQPAAVVDAIVAWVRGL
jgi:pimeloyl-ACP methyl ester carboxylesterase